MKLNTELGVAVDEYENSEGRRVSKQLTQLALSRWIFERNYDELRAHIDVFETSTDPLDFLRRQDEFQGYLREAARLLHNWLASATSLVDHASGVARKLGAGAFAVTYDTRRRALTYAPRSAFVRQLRNVVQHIDALAPDGKIDFLAGGPRSSLHLRKDRLLEYAVRPRAAADWTVARPFLDAQLDDVPVGSILADFRTDVVAFCDWLDAELRALHAKPLQDLQALRQTIEEIRAQP